MTQNETIFLWMCIINAIIVVIYAVWNIVREDKGRSFWAKCFLMLICPIVGPIVILLGHIFYRFFLLHQVDLEDVIFSKEQVKTYLPADLNNEPNMAPMEEAIRVTDKNELRTLLLNVVKEDVDNSMSAIALALNSEDTEVAHYAASVLQESLNKLRTDVQKGRQYIEENDPKLEEEDTLEYMNGTIVALNKLLREKLLSDVEYRSMVHTLDLVCQLLYDQKPERMLLSQYEIVCLRLLEAQEYDRCQIWCDRLMAQYPNSLASYSCQMKLSYSLMDRERFFQTMTALRSSDVEIDNETLEMIRVFM